MKTNDQNHKNGFTLLEILLVLGILGVIAVFTIGIAHSIRNLTKVNDTKSRIEQVAAKAKEYYRTHQQMAGPSTTPSESVPVGASVLDMEQKFRLDGWGQYLHYETTNAITGFTVDGKNVAGVIISSGPDQGFEDTSPPSFTTAGDDIVIPINVSQEAIEIALDDLKVLQSKVEAFDAQFEGVDNNGTGGVDEHDCTADSGTDCPPNNVNDPNCGRASLDTIGSYTSCGFSTTSAYTFIRDLYSLSSNLDQDPWGNAYAWGTANHPVASHQHKFFSGGPDGTATSNDDIVP